MVRAAADQVGVSEAKLRAAYRRGELDVRDDLVNGRMRKLVNLPDVLAWAGIAPPVVQSPGAEAPSSEAPVQVLKQLEVIADEARRALDRASRAEQQVIFLRNELAQLREAQDRVQEIVDERSLTAFRTVATVTATSALTPVRRKRFLGITRRVSA